MSKIISNVLEPPPSPLGELVAHAENLIRFVGSFIRLAQVSAEFGDTIAHLIAVADDALDGLREAAKTVRAREHGDVIDPEDEVTNALVAVEEHLSGSVRLLDHMIDLEGRGTFARPLRRLSQKLREIFEEVEALRIYILEHDADADPESIGPFETADELITALHGLDTGTGICFNLLQATPGHPRAPPNSRRPT